MVFKVMAGDNLRFAIGILALTAAVYSFAALLWQFA